MILRATSDKTTANDAFVPAWQVVHRMQRQLPSEYWLVTQPDHARLSGRIAQALDSDRFPQLTPGVIECIGQHDEGWRQFDGAIPHPAKPRFDENGKPVTFIELLPDMFIPAWGASVENAMVIDGVGGATVSRHFSWLAEYRLRTSQDTPEHRERLQHFANAEKHRQARIAGTPGIEREIDDALKLLQFCDLLSLYLCTGSAENVEFPQDFGEGPVRLSREGEYCVLSASPLAAPITLQCPAFIPQPDGSYVARGIVCELRN